MSSSDSSSSHSDAHVVDVKVSPIEEIPSEDDAKPKVTDSCCLSCLKRTFRWAFSGSVISYFASCLLLVVLTVVYVFVVIILSVSVPSILPEPKPASISPTEYSEARAMEFLKALTDLGSRPTYSRGNIAALQWLEDSVSDLLTGPDVASWLNYEISRHEYSAENHTGIPQTKPLVNYLVRIWSNASASFGPGTNALLLVGHYDSYVPSLGAYDNGNAIVTLLELLRNIITRSVGPEHDVIFLWDNSEENGLWGAYEFQRTHEWYADVARFINLEAMATSGRSILFRLIPEAVITEIADRETSRGFFANCLGADLMKLTPSFTDFAVLSEAYDHPSIPLVSGVDFAFYELGYFYHTSGDSFASVTLPKAIGGLQDSGERTLALVERYVYPTSVSDSISDPLGLPDPDADVNPDTKYIFFDILGGPLWVYSHVTQILLSVGMFVLMSALVVLDCVWDILTRNGEWDLDDFEDETVVRVARSDCGEYLRSVWVMGRFVVFLLYVVSYVVSGGVGVFLPIIVGALMSSIKSPLGFFSQPYISLIFYGLVAVLGLMVPQFGVKMLLQHCIAKKKACCRCCGKKDEDPVVVDLTDDVYAGSRYSKDMMLALAWTCSGATLIVSIATKIYQPLFYTIGLFGFALLCFIVRVLLEFKITLPFCRLVLCRRGGVEVSPSSDAQADVELKDVNVAGSPRKTARKSLSRTGSSVSFRRQKTNWSRKAGRKMLSHFQDHRNILSLFMCLLPLILLFPTLLSTDVLWRIHTCMVAVMERVIFPFSPTLIIALFCALFFLAIFAPLVPWFHVGDHLGKIILLFFVVLLCVFVAHCVIPTYTEASPHWVITRAYYESSESIALSSIGIGSSLSADALDGDSYLIVYSRGAEHIHVDDRIFEVYNANDSVIAASLSVEEASVTEKGYFVNLPSTRDIEGVRVPLPPEVAPTIERVQSYVLERHSASNFTFTVEYSESTFGWVIVRATQGDPWSVSWNPSSPDDDVRVVPDEVEVTTSTFYKTNQISTAFNGTFAVSGPIEVEVHLNYCEAESLPRFAKETIFDPNPHAAWLTLRIPMCDVLQTTTTFLLTP